MGSLVKRWNMILLKLLKEQTEFEDEALKAVTKLLRCFESLQLKFKQTK